MGQPTMPCDARLSCDSHLRRVVAIACALLAIGSVVHAQQPASPRFEHRLKQGPRATATTKPEFRFSEDASELEASRRRTPAKAVAQRTEEEALSPILRDPEPHFTPWLHGLSEVPDEQGITFPESFPPSGYTGPSGIAPSEVQTTPDFEPVEDRWRIGMQPWDRYNEGHSEIEREYPFVEGARYDPYHQNVLKGDYPILGQHTFLFLTGTNDFLLEARQVPTPNSPFESTPHPDSPEFFGDPDQFLLVNNANFSFDVVHGDGAFKPADWRFKMTQVFNVNHLVVDEFGVVNPDVRRGTARTRADYAIEEWFYETKLADLSADYDFMSVRAGSQFFSSDFRGFIFSDTNRGVRLFGTRNANRDQFNVAWFDMVEKDTNSFLNTFDDRHQNVVAMNYYRQDFIWPGYTAALNYLYDLDKPSFEFDTNNNLVRPDPAGVAAQHKVRAHYLGWTGDGHINRFNITHAFYMAIGDDSLNPIAGRPQDIFAQMAALELSYDRDWARFRSSYFWASGDGNPNDEDARGFDTILDNPAFAGGQFSYWNRQQIKLFGVNLTQRLSLVPDLRSSKLQGQANFVNPGLHLLNFGSDYDLTPKHKLITNVNFLWFDQTETLETFVFQRNIHNFIGADLSAGLEYRPLLNNNIIFVGGVSCLVPGQGYRDLFQPLNAGTDELGALFTNLILTY
jgi:hypothetical protein